MSSASPIRTEGEGALSIPKNWRKPAFVNSRDDLLNKTQAALGKNQATVPLPPPSDPISFEMPAMLANQLATFDTLSGMQMQYNDTVHQILSVVLQESPGYLNTIAYGYAAMRANRAYGGSEYLQMAKTAWETTYAYTITPEQASRRSASPTKNATVHLAGQCQSATIAGGTFALEDQNDMLVNGVASGAFLALSGLLANATGNSTYIDSATRSFQFIYNQLHGSSTTPIGGIQADTCEVFDPSGLADAALFLEGTAILGSVTKNDTLRELTSDLIQAFLLNTNWLNPQGILTNTFSGAEPQSLSAGDLGHFMRAFSTAYEVYWNDTVVQDNIRAFVAVQCNALLDFAAKDGVYGGTWEGIPDGFSYNYVNQSAAIDLLLSGVLMDNNITSSTNSTASPSPGPALPSGTALANRGHRSNIGSIVGGAVGGFFGLLMIIVLVALIIRRYRRRSAAMPTPSEPFVEPPRGSEVAQPKHPLETEGLANDSSALASSSPTTPPVSSGGEGQRVTIGSLIWELNELLRRGGISAHSPDSEDVHPPPYTSLN